MTLYETLLHGIAMKSPLALSRKQDGGRMRYVCPHAIGYSKDDVLNLFCYQYDGYSSSKLAIVGSDRNWRCYCVSDLVEASVAEGEWQTATKVSCKPPNCISRVVAQV